VIAVNDAVAHTGSDRRLRTVEPVRDR
jgi:hypothetical protein